MSFRARSTLPAGKQFLTTSTEAFTFSGDWSGQLVATAIHNGHDLRDDTARLMKLDLSWTSLVPQGAEDLVGVVVDGGLGFEFLVGDADGDVA